MTSPAAPDAPLPDAPLPEAAHRPPVERVRLTTPGDYVAAAPHLIGFHPTESLVVCALRPPRGRVRLTLRFDLLDPAHDEPLARDVARRLAAVGADSALLVVFTETGHDLSGPTAGLPRAALVDAVVAALRADDVETRDAIVTSGGRWRSYRCDDASCCDGPQPVPPPSTHLAAASAFTGRAVLPDRAALVESLRAVRGPAREGMLQAIIRQDDLIAVDGAAALARFDAESTRLFREAVDRFDAGATRMTDDEAARLILGLESVLVRDEVLSWCLGRAEPLRSLLVWLARRAVPPYDAPTCTAAAWVCYFDGDATSAGILLDRALASRPDYSLALLVEDMLERQVPPAALRGVVAALQEPRPGPRGSGRRRPRLR